MSRSYRFVRFGPAMEPAGEIDLICRSDDDALLLAERVGPRVEVWDGERRVGQVGLHAPAAEAAAAPRIVPEVVSDPVPQTAAQAAPQIMPDPPAPAPAAQAEPLAADPTQPPRPLNPFRREAWRGVRGRGV